MKFELWLTFLVVCTLFSISPGPGAVSSMSNSLSYGFSRGFLNVLGLQCALLVHLTLVGLGLGALVASSEVAFQTLKYLGAGYLIYLGYKKWTHEGVLVFGFLAASLRGFFQNEAKMRLANKVFGGLFTLAGIALATAKRPAS